MSTLKPCPCGKTPDRLHVGSISSRKWAVVYGSCCGEWKIEFRTRYAVPTSQKCMQLAIAAWNCAPRVAPPSIFDLVTRVIRDTDLTAEQKGEILKIATQEQVSLTSEERAILDKNRWDLYE